MEGLLHLVESSPVPLSPLLQLREMPGQRGPVPVPVQANGGDLTLQILETLESQDPLQTQDAFPTSTQIEIKAALDRLASRHMVVYETKDTEQAILTDEGQQIADEGSHEYKVWDAVKSNRRLSLKNPAVSLDTHQCACVSLL